MDWGQLLGQLGLSGMVLAALAYLLRSLIGAQFEKDRIRFQESLRVDSEKSLEQFRAELLQASQQNDAKHRQLLVLRQEAAIAIQHCFLDARSRLRNLANGAPRDHDAAKQSLEEAEAAAYGVKYTILDHQIVFTAAFVQTMLDAWLELMNCWHSVKIEWDLVLKGREDTPRFWQNCEKSMKALEEKLMPLESAILNEFRRMLGVD